MVAVQISENTVLVLQAPILSVGGSSILNGSERSSWDGKAGGDRG